MLVSCFEPFCLLVSFIYVQLIVLYRAIKLYRWLYFFFLVCFSTICTAAEHLLESDKQMGNIADSLSTLQALNSADPDQMIQGLHSSLVKFLVFLRWVLAQAPQTQNPVTYREAKAFLYSQFNGDWKKENGGYQAHLDPIWRLERAQQTAIFHLRTGHCGLRAPLKRIGIWDTSLCECGQADQTPDHILQFLPKICRETSANMAAGC